MPTTATIHDSLASHTVHPLFLLHIPTLARCRLAPTPATMNVDTALGLPTTQKCLSGVSCALPSVSSGAQGTNALTKMLCRSPSLPRRTHVGRPARVSISDDQACLLPNVHGDDIDIHVHAATVHATAIHVATIHASPWPSPPLARCSIYTPEPRVSPRRVATAPVSPPIDPDCAHHRSNRATP
ncbi:hypothetical protein FOMPIDRAFT_1054501 [Fomitopsis schrenkii]|uniref:Uncharacterized protein n=1 Tax=Fomitopsis schrenkii TaxID=2126942 RepID=S8F8R0_FOMSC|nr:hypothetical protein FOMPIDRAFT_1054501 [Fomitopsis schrenkii]